MEEDQMELEEFLQQLVSLIDKRFEKLEKEISGFKADLSMIKHSSGSLPDLHKRLNEAENQIKVLRSRKEPSISTDLLKRLE